MITHSCIKTGCENKYQDNEIDAYYCKEHLSEKKRIAAEIDKKFAGRSTEKTMSDLELYDSQAKVMKGPNGRMITFAPTKL